MTRARRGRQQGSYVGERVGGGGLGCGERELAAPAPGNARRPRGSREEALLRATASCRPPA